MAVDHEDRRLRLVKELLQIHGRPTVQHDDRFDIRKLLGHVLRGGSHVGIPRNQIRLLPVDSTYRLDHDQAARAIEADRNSGLKPFLLVSHAGTTNTGAIDDLVKGRQLADKFSLWWHVDAAYGGFFMLTDRGRRRLVGMEAAVALNDFIKNYKRQVTVKDVIDDGKLHLVKDFANNEHLSLIEKMKAENLFSEAMNATQLQNLAEYFVSLPSEIAMTIWTHIGKAKCQENIAGFHGTVTKDGTKVNMHIVELMNRK